MSLNQTYYNSEKIYEDAIENNYIVLVEMNKEECETWYYFIKSEGNQESLCWLHQQLKQVNWYLIKDISIFTLDIHNVVSEKTASEMCTLQINQYSSHRKFDGILQFINCNLLDTDTNYIKMLKIYNLLGYGQIEQYINNEDDIKIIKN